MAWLLSEPASNPKNPDRDAGSVRTHRQRTHGNGIPGLDKRLLGVGGYGGMPQGLAVCKPPETSHPAWTVQAAHLCDLVVSLPLFPAGLLVAF